MHININNPLIIQRNDIRRDIRRQVNRNRRESPNLASTKSRTWSSTRYPGNDDDVYLDKNNKQGVLKNLSSANVKRRLQPIRHKEK
jgi:hypothetical protein